MKAAKRKTEFLGPLLYDDLSSFKHPIWLKLRVPFSYYSAVLRHEVTIPAGFECDGRSTPRPLWGVVPPVGPALWAAVPHDHLYTVGGYFIDENRVVIDQATADAVYRELMIARGFPRWKSWWSYAALRLFGRIAWDEHRRRD
jgi:hypothetical protein